MAKKFIPEPEPEGTAEEIQETKEETEEVEEEKPIVKPKRVLTETQLESLKRARLLEKPPH